MDTLILLVLAFQVEPSDTMMSESVNKHKDQLTKGIRTKGTAKRIFYWGARIFVASLFVRIRKEPVIAGTQ